MLSGAGGQLQQVRTIRLVEKKSKKIDPIRIDAAITQVKANATAKFDETIELAIKLGLDPRKPNENIRGATMMPHGTGKVVRVAVFARGDNAEAAKEAGATLVGAEDLVAEIEKGVINFDKCIATPYMMVSGCGQQREMVFPDLLCTSL